MMKVLVLLIYHHILTPYTVCLSHNIHGREGTTCNMHRFRFQSRCRGESLQTHLPLAMLSLLDFHQRNSTFGKPINYPLLQPLHMWFVVHVYQAFVTECLICYFNSERASVHSCGTAFSSTRSGSAARPWRHDCIWLYAECSERVLCLRSEHMEKGRDLAARWSGRKQYLDPLKGISFGQHAKQRKMGKDYIYMPVPLCFACPCCLMLC